MRALTFDLDGTLASVRWRRLGLWRAFLASPAVLGAYEPAVRALRGRRFADLPGALETEVCARSGKAPEEVSAALASAIGTVWPTLFAGARPASEVQWLLDAADDAGLPRVVVSDHPSLDKLAAMGLGGWTAVVDCTALGALKPLPDGIWAAAAALGIPPSEILHVGDRWDTDGGAAAAAGCAFLHISQIKAQREFVTSGRFFGYPGFAPHPRSP